MGITFQPRSYTIERTRGSSSCGPVVVQPYVRHDEALVVRVPRLILVDRPQDPPHELNVRRQAPEWSEDCRDSLPGFGVDSSELKIPVRNVGKREFESLLAASDGKPEKWLKWIKVE